MKYSKRPLLLRAWLYLQNLQASLKYRSLEMLLKKTDFRNSAAVLKRWHSRRQSAIVSPHTNDNANRSSWSPTDWPWRYRHYDPSKHIYEPLTQWHGVTSKDTNLQQGRCQNLKRCHIVNQIRFDQFQPDNSTLGTCAVATTSVGKPRKKQK
jgi:hypothetical protein